jgi:hypothetical protein
MTHYIANAPVISNYDDVRNLVEKSPGPFSVANCVCRQMKDMRGQHCKYSDIVRLVYRSILTMPDSI